MFSLLELKVDKIQIKLNIKIRNKNVTLFIHVVIGSHCTVWRQEFAIPAQMSLKGNIDSASNVRSI